MLDTITREYILQNLRSVDRSFSSAYKAFSNNIGVSYKEIVRKEYWTVHLCLNSHGLLYLEVDYAGKKFARTHLIAFGLDLPQSLFPAELLGKKIHSRLINRMYLMKAVLLGIQNFIRASTASIATGELYAVATTMSLSDRGKYLKLISMFFEAGLSDEVIQKVLEVNSMLPPPEPSWLDFGE